MLLVRQSGCAVWKLAASCAATPACRADTMLTPMLDDKVYKLPVNSKTAKYETCNSMTASQLLQMI